ncbi:MAG: exodeoxyribonuclease VII large subunit [Methanobrevibacter sp.]
MIITDKDIYEIALITTIIGIVGLILTSGFIEPKELSINQITSSNINEKIVIHGTISSIKYSKNSKTCFISLNDKTGRINLILFESGLDDFNNHNIDINQFKNRNVKVTGTVTQYKNELELSLEDSNSIKFE